MLNALPLLLLFSAASLFNICLSSTQVSDLWSPSTSGIVKYVNENDGRRYHFMYVNSDNQQREETGELVTKGNKQVLVVEGYYGYVIDDRYYNYFEYEADDNGFRIKPAVQLATKTGYVGSALLSSLAGGGLG